MKLIIIEGTDNVGKDTLISRIMENYDVMTVIHCGKPKSKDHPNESQDSLFNFYIKSITNKKYDNSDVIIMNRSHIGEAVYGVLYRNRDINEVLKKIHDWNVELMKCPNLEVKYIQLLSTSERLLKNNEDGQSLSKGNSSNIIKETALFTEAYVKSFLDKKLIYVDNNGEFRTKEEIFEEARNFIDK